ncbi:MAG TPA: hypothetical protein PK575_11820 [Syntrophorhabdus sp.]|jgi:hypothetical protein|nr:hypothetical protein [Syntrophorhabdus sp.]HQI97392.1 hypothetical protein [Syntrophorhabdus sp.]
MKETLSPYGRVRHKFSPEGLDVDRLGCSISQAVKEYFIRVHRRSSCENILCNNDALLHTTHPLPLSVSDKTT